jgi:hypothetical protein
MANFEVRQFIKTEIAMALECKNAGVYSIEQMRVALNVLRRLSAASQTTADLALEVDRAKSTGGVVLWMQENGGRRAERDFDCLEDAVRFLGFYRARYGFSEVVRAYANGEDIDVDQFNEGERA